MGKIELVIQFAHIFHLIAVNLLRLTRFCIFVGDQAIVKTVAAAKMEAINSFFCMVFSLLFSHFQ